MRRLISGIFALALLAAVVPFSAHAGQGTVNYKPGVLKAAAAKGQSVLVHYKSTW